MLSSIYREQTCQLESKFFPTLIITVNMDELNALLDMNELNALLQNEVNALLETYPEQREPPVTEEGVPGSGLLDDLITQGLLPLLPRSLTCQNQGIRITK